MVGKTEGLGSRRCEVVGFGNDANKFLKKKEIECGQSGGFQCRPGWNREVAALHLLLFGMLSRTLPPTHPLAH